MDRSYQEEPALLVSRVGRVRAGILKHRVDLADESLHRAPFYLSSFTNKIGMGSRIWGKTAVGFSISPKLIKELNC